MSRGQKKPHTPALTPNGKPDYSVEGAKVRIDKWLWAARFYKTRSLATEMVEGGKVKCNDDRVKPAYGLQVGDILSIPVGWDEMIVQVKALGDKRGSATIARTLYEETPASILERTRRAENRKLVKDPSVEIKARPTKKDRRAMEDWRWTSE